LGTYTGPGPENGRIAFDAGIAGIQALPREPRLSGEASFGWQAVAAAERVFAAVLLGVVLPPLAVVVAALAVLSRRQPLVAHARVGQNGRELRVLKLRTMWPRGAPQRTSGALLVEHLRPEPVRPGKAHDDPRVTSRFAAFCRRYSIDELPQLWHVVRGEMALVGPRPLTADELIEHYGLAAAEVLRAKPGLTGLWQVRGRSNLSYRNRRRLDLFLVRRRSFRLYAGILLATASSVVTGKNAW